MRINQFLALLGIVLLAGCGGSGQSVTAERPALSGDGSLRFSATPVGGDWVVELAASGMADLYQIAGTVEFPAADYAVSQIEPGGGLGAADDSYFVGKETSPGRLAFGYTKRFYGAGATGEVQLLHFSVRPRGKFRLEDFTLDANPGQLLMRDSRKQPLLLEGGVAR